jgi:glycosyltransferase involved in cell wall biosynthesis
LSNVGAATLLHSERVRFFGMVDRERLDDLYAGADIVFVPSRYESFGLVAIEAMAAGATVVVLGAGGLAEVIADDISGKVIEPDGREVESATEVLRRLIGDPDLRRRLGLGARAAYEKHYTIEKMIDGAEIAIEKAMKHRGL